MFIRKFESLLETGYFNTAVSFETYWQTGGRYHWKSKTNAWVDWIHDQWNTGLINLDDYRYLIYVEFDE